MLSKELEAFWALCGIVLDRGAYISIFVEDFQFESIAVSMQNKKDFGACQTGSTMANITTSLDQNQSTRCPKNDTFFTIQHCTASFTIGS